MLNDILPDFQRYLAEKNLVSSDKIPFHALWVSKFLVSPTSGEFLRNSGRPYGSSIIPIVRKGPIWTGAAVFLPILRKRRITRGLRDLRKGKNSYRSAY